MAEIIPTVSERMPGFTKVTWQGVRAGDTCRAHTVTRHSAVIASMQVTGVFGAGAAAMHISNDGTTFVDSGVSLDAAGIADFTSASPHIKPVGAGDAGTGLTYTVVLWGH